MEVAHVSGDIVSTFVAAAGSEHSSIGSIENGLAGEKVLEVEPASFQDSASFQVQVLDFESTCR
jgi:hypothetical protein